MLAGTAGRQGVAKGDDNSGHGLKSSVGGLNAGDLHLREGRGTVRSGIGRGRQVRSIDLTSVGGAPAPAQFILRALTDWQDARAWLFPHPDDDTPLFVTPGPAGVRGVSGRNPEERRMTVEAIRLVLRRAAQRAGLPPRRVTAGRLRHFSCESAEAETTATDVAGRRFARRTRPTRSEVEEILSTPGLSLSEIARRLFNRA